MIPDPVKRNFWMLEAMIIIFVLLGIAFGNWSSWFGRFGWVTSVILVLASLLGGMIIGMVAQGESVYRDVAGLKRILVQPSAIRDAFQENRKLYKEICIGVIELSVNRVANKIVAKYAPDISQEDIRQSVLTAMDEIVAEEMASVRRDVEEQINLKKTT